MTQYMNRNRIKEDLLNIKKTTIIFQYNRKIIAYATYELKKSILWSIFVKPDFSRKGIGAHIISIIANIFKKKSIDKIKLYSRLNAINF